MAKDKDKGKKRRQKQPSQQQQVKPPEPPQVTPPSKVDLCETCIYDRDTCGVEEDQVQYVNDQGGQRVITCQVFQSATTEPEKPPEEPPEADQKPPQPPEPSEQKEPVAEEGKPDEPPQETPPASVPIGGKPEENEEDFGACSCGWNFRRTAYTSHHDAVRCVNPRCNFYRMIQRRIPPLSLAERLARSKGE